MASLARLPQWSRTDAATLALSGRRVWRIASQSTSRWRMWRLAATSVSAIPFQVARPVLIGLLITAVETRQSPHVTMLLAVILLAELASLVVSRVQVGQFVAVQAAIDAHVRRLGSRAALAPATVEHLDDDDWRTKLGALTTGPGPRLGSGPEALVLATVAGATRLAEAVVLASFSVWAAVVAYLLGSVVGRAMQIARQPLNDAYASTYGEARRSAYLALLMEAPTAAREMRIYQSADWLLSEAGRQWTAWHTRVARARASVSWRLTGAAAGWMLLSGLALIPVLGAFFDGRLSLGAVITAFLLTLSVTEGGSQPELAQIAPRLDAYDRMQAWLQELDPGASAPPVERDPSLLNGIHVQSVSYRYASSETQVLEQVSVSVDRGQTIAVVGANGAGKSTLMLLVAGLLLPEAGRVSSGGLTLSAESARRWQAQVAAAFQEFSRIPDTLEKNIALGMSVDQGHLATALSVAGIDWLDELPAGVHTYLSPQFAGGVDLSGGQWQRVSIARAVYGALQGATCLILDEPTSQLDLETEINVLQRIRRALPDVSILLVTHRLVVAKQADTVALLQKGRLVAQGSHQSLLGTPLYAEMWRQQSSPFVSDAGRAEG